MIWVCLKMGYTVYRYTCLPPNGNVTEENDDKLPWDFGAPYIYNSQENLTKPQGLTTSGRCWDIPRSGGAQFSYPRGYSKQGIFPPFPMGITDSLQPEQLEAWRPCGQMREVCKLMKTRTLLFSK